MFDGFRWVHCTSDGFAAIDAPEFGSVDLAIIAYAKSYSPRFDKHPMNRRRAFASITESSPSRPMESAGALRLCRSDWEPW